MAIQGACLPSNTLWFRWFMFAVSSIRALRAGSKLHPRSSSGPKGTFICMQTVFLFALLFFFSSVRTLFESEAFEKITLPQPPAPDPSPPLVFACIQGSCDFSSALFVWKCLLVHPLGFVRPCLLSNSGKMSGVYKMTHFAFNRDIFSVN